MALLCLYVLQLQGPGLSEATDGECVALFGHAVFLNAIALQVALGAGAAEGEVEKVLDMDLVS